MFAYDLYKNLAFFFLINEEALLFAKFVRDERDTWIPRIAKSNLQT